MTKEQKQATIEALIRERYGYELRVVKATEDEDEDALAAAKDRVAQVDAQLKALGAAAKTPAKRASKRARR